MMKATTATIIRKQLLIRIEHEVLSSTHLFRKHLVIINTGSIDKRRWANGVIPIKDDDWIVVWWRHDSNVVLLYTDKLSYRWIAGIMTTRVCLANVNSNNGPETRWSSCWCLRDSPFTRLSGRWLLRGFFGLRSLRVHCGGRTRITPKITTAIVTRIWKLM